jgi:tetratricopeptide (TPR) repeat protein
MPNRPIPSRPDRAARHCLLAALLALAVPVIPRAVTAAPTETDGVKRAREHHKRGVAAFEAGRYEEALREWEAGYKLSPRPLFLLNMGHAERRRGELGNARSLYKRYLLTEPETKLRGEVEAVIKEIDSALEDGRTLPATPAAETLTPPAPETPAPASPPSIPDGPVETAPAASAPIALPAAAPDPLPHVAPALVTPAANVAVAPPQPRPFYRRWWFWTGAGALVAAGVVTALVLRQGDDYSKTGSLGTIGGAP